MTSEEYISWRKEQYQALDDGLDKAIVAAQVLQDPVMFKLLDIKRFVVRVIIGSDT